jgi:hypothetical protein
VCFCHKLRSHRSAIAELHAQSPLRPTIDKPKLSVFFTTLQPRINCRAACVLGEQLPTNSRTSMCHRSAIAEPSRMFMIQYILIGNCRTICTSQLYYLTK